MIMEGSRDTEDGMARTPTERLLQQQIQTLFPRLSRHWRRALARWVLGALLAGSANRPALAPALATAGIARAATLADAWDAWIAAPAHRIDTADPPAADAPPVVSPLACGADLLRWIRAHWTGGPLVLGLDASHRRADVVLLRMSVLYRGAALPVAWVIVPANQPGAWGTALGADAALGPQRAAARPGGPHAGGSGGVEPPAVARHPVAAVPSHHAGASHVDLRADRSGALSRCCVWRPDRGMDGWARGVAFKHAPKRIAGTLAVAWGAGHAEPWAPLVERSAAQVDAAWYALRSWDEAGFRQSTSMGWDWQRGQVTDPDAVAWQYLVVATVTLWTVAVGTRIEDAEQQGVPPGRLRRAPPTTGAPLRRRWSGTAQRVISLLRRGAGRRLRWLLAQGRCWVRLWLRPEPLPKIGDSITMHIDDPSQCLKSP
jgi:hypothetical protein